MIVLDSQSPHYSEGGNSPPSERRKGRSERAKRGNSARRIPNYPNSAPPESNTDPHRLAKLHLESVTDSDGSLKVRYWKGAWWSWDGSRYRLISEEELRTDVMRTMKSAFDEFAKRESRSPAHATKGRASNVLEAMKGYCEVPSHLHQPVWLGAEGSSAQYFAFKNGLLRVDHALDGTPRLISPTPKWFSPACFPFDYDADATSPRFDDFLAEIFEPDPDATVLLQEVIGYLLLPDTSQQKFFIFEGSGRNGKGVTTTTLTNLLGPENVSNVPLEQFGERFALAPTAGKLVNIVHELDRPGALAEGTLKQFVSGDQMTIDRKHRDPVQMKPTARVLITTNELPNFRDRSSGMARRLVLLRFPVQVAEGKADPALADKLAKELPGIFNWALGGLRRLSRNGSFSLPESSEVMLEEMKPERDSTDLFFSEHVEVTPDHFALTEDLYVAYVGFCGHRFTPVSRAAFGTALNRKLNVKPRREGSGLGGKRRYGYVGVRLKASSPSESSGHVSTSSPPNNQPLTDTE